MYVCFKKMQLNLTSNENNKLGTTYLSNHRHDDFKREYLSIHKEAKRIGVIL